MRFAGVAFAVFAAVATLAAVPTAAAEDIGVCVLVDDMATTGCDPDADVLLVWGRVGAENGPSACGGVEDRTGHVPETEWFGPQVPAAQSGLIEPMMEPRVYVGNDIAICVSDQGIYLTGCEFEDQPGQQVTTQRLEHALWEPRTP